MATIENVITSVLGGNNVLVIGPGGAGKTSVQETFKTMMSSTTVQVSSTGVSALLNEGMTAHRAFTIPFGIPVDSDYSKYTPNPTTRNLFNKKSDVSLVLFDEVGMIRSDSFSFADFALKKRYKNNKPFGGLQMALFCDLCQLPPVVKDNERSILNDIYGSEYFFETEAFNQGNFEVLMLDKIYRQSDIEMQKHLNNIRLYGQNFNIKESLDFFNDNCVNKIVRNAPHIVTTNAACDSLNNQMFNKLATPVFNYQAKVRGKWKDKPAPESLSLRVGTRVMMTRNHGEGHYANGSTGTVYSLTKTNCVVELDNGNHVRVHPYRFVQSESFVDSEGKLHKRETGVFEQLPIRVCFATTVHRTQGQTLESAIIDFGWKCFASGQAYVGLSRLRSIDGLSLVRALKSQDIIPNPTVLRFMEKHMNT